MHAFILENTIIIKLTCRKNHKIQIFLVNIPYTVNTYLYNDWTHLFAVNTVGFRSNAIVCDVIKSDTILSCLYRWFQRLNEYFGSFGIKLLSEKQEQNGTNYVDEMMTTRIIPPRDASQQNCLWSRVVRVITSPDPTLLQLNCFVDWRRVMW